MVLDMISTCRDGKGIREEGMVGGFDQNILYACMKLKNKSNSKVDCFSCHVVNKYAFIYIISVLAEL